jgi:hypothetical protein
MNTSRSKKFIHKGNYAAEVEVELTQDDDSWGQYLSLTDARKLDDVRIALRRGDIKSAARVARIYSLTPIAVQQSARPLGPVNTI